MDFDVIVVGGGVAGVSAALRASELGKSVALVEKDQIGGECINRACIPSKTLIDAVKMVRKVYSSSWIASSASLDYTKLNENKMRIISAIKEKMERNLHRRGVKVVKGGAKIVGQGEVRVGEDIITADSLVISTGSVPLSLPDFPLNGKNVLDPWTAMNMKEIGKRIIIVGGGVAGVELATLFRSLGREVTVLELMPQLLPGFDKDIASATKRRLEEKGIRVYLNAKSKIVSAEGEVKFSVNLPNSSEEIHGDLAVVTIGRKASTENLNLNEMKVEVDQRGYIKVDERGRTSNGKVFAAGDVAGVPLSATKAWRQGTVVGDNLGGKDTKMPRYIPTSIFADVEIGIVGRTLDDLKKMGVEGKEITVEMKDIPRAWTLNETEGFLKLVISGDKIEGAHMIGEGATEVINTVALAMELGASLRQLYPVTFSHPTVSEIVSEAIQRLTYGELY
ncbi:NAD(P)/FAD-dependent oxidoreductase [Metallosphaera tengchongensis]|uniref:NAD(P)/FAD-dependent oxidoreductase n=1 Tax=Metallosphaera tengchongensis TaxID=1532350 RepID=A0A6N0NWX7_9CREN|nr:NAD(P)/FAD-dependent oxidoreductase [Metallosphaera tengchongensis]QKQ99610.1 NAD(P)/FAD-dependent oxidoreductase [Metallosphaera tengchongensis]